MVTWQLHTGGILSPRSRILHLRRDLARESSGAGFIRCDWQPRGVPLLPLQTVQSPFVVFSWCKRTPGMRQNQDRGRTGTDRRRRGSRLLCERPVSCVVDHRLSLSVFVSGVLPKSFISWPFLAQINAALLLAIKETTGEDVPPCCCPPAHASPSGRRENDVKGLEMTRRHRRIRLLLFLEGVHRGRLRTEGHVGDFLRERSRRLR